MMPVEQSSIDLFLSRLQSSASLICLSYSLDFLKTELITELVKCIINLIQEAKELLACVTLGNQVQLVDLDENHGDLWFLFCNIFLSKFDFVSDQRGYKDVENLLEFDVAPHFSVAIDELGFFLELLDVNIPGPNESCEDSYCCAESRNKSVELLFVGHSQETEKDVHHHWHEDHHHGDVNVGVIQTSHEGKHKNEPSRLQTLTFGSVDRIAENDDHGVKQKQIWQVCGHPGEYAVNDDTEYTQGCIVVDTDIGVPCCHW